jgi:hypothetical protein
VSTKEIIVRGVPDVTTAIRAMAKAKRMSITALVETGGVANGSLTSIGTGSTTKTDMALGPLLRVLRAVGWEMVGRSVDPTGVMIQVDRGLPIRVVGADGGRLLVPIVTMDDVPILLNTMAAANGLTMSGLVTLTGMNSTSLVGMARGTGANKDLRLTNLVRLVGKARFELVVRPQHQSMRDARIAVIGAARDNGTLQHS